MTQNAEEKKVVIGAKLPKPRSSIKMIAEQKDFRNLECGKSTQQSVGRQRHRDKAMITVQFMIIYFDIQPKIDRKKEIKIDLDPSPDYCHLADITKI